MPDAEPPQPNPLWQPPKVLITVLRWLRRCHAVATRLSGRQLGIRAAAVGACSVLLWSIRKQQRALAQIRRVPLSGLLKHSAWEREGESPPACPLSHMISRPPLPNRVNDVRCVSQSSRTSASELRECLEECA